MPPPKTKASNWEEDANPLNNWNVLTEACVPGIEIALGAPRFTKLVLIFRVINQSEGSHLHLGGEDICEYEGYANKKESESTHNKRDKEFFEDESQSLKIYIRGVRQQERVGDYCMSMKQYLHS